MTEKVEKLLGDVRTLLIIQLLKSGTKSEEIGKSLGVDGSAIRHILAGTKHKHKKGAKDGKEAR